MITRRSCHVIHRGSCCASRPPQKHCQVTLCNAIKTKPTVTSPTIARPNYNHQQLLPGQTCTCA